MIVEKKFGSIAPSMPEQGHQVPQEEGDGDGEQVGGPGDRAEGAIGPIFLDNHHYHYISISV